MRIGPEYRTHLCGHDILVAAGEEPPKQTSGDAFASPIGIVVTGVEECDPSLDGPADDRLGGGLVKHPRAPSAVAEAHHAEAYAGYG